MFEGVPVINIQVLEPQWNNYHIIKLLDFGRTTFMFSLLNVFLPIINWLNQQRHGGNGRSLKSKRRSKYSTYTYFPVKQSHLSNVWSVQITLCMQVINIQDHNKTICSLLWLLCPVLLWPTLRPIWNLHGIGQWSQMLRKLNIQETLGKHVPCQKCNCTVHITTVEQNLEDVWLFLKLQKLFSFQNLFLLP